VESDASAVNGKGEGAITLKGSSRINEKRMQEAPVWGSKGTKKHVVLKAKSSNY